MNSLNINDFDYILPDEKIAKYPLKERDKSKLLYFDGGNISETQFYNLQQLLDNDDFIIYNNTKVIQARLNFHKSTGANIEIFCLEPHEPADCQISFQTTEKCVWKVLIGNAKRWKSDILTRKFACHCGFDQQLIAGQDRNDTNCNDRQILFSAKYIAPLENMTHLVEFQWNNPDFTFGEILQNIGELPIPPYLNRKTEESDKTTYQTVYSKIFGSVAAPTAGLHFTPQVFREIADKGLKISEITLHVGAGTFQPIKSENVAEHEMHAEFFTLQKSVIEQIIENLENIVAVGTTSVRTLESLYYIGCHIAENSQNPDFSVSQWEAYEKKHDIPTKESLQNIVNYLINNNLTVLNANTKIIIVPNFKFRIVRKMLTNFHQPKSTLLLLVSAFVGDENRKKIYDYALNNDFRFLSYGDSSLLMTTKQDNKILCQKAH